MLTEHTLFRLAQIGRSMWLRPALYALGAALALVLGPFLDPFIPKELYNLLQENAVSNVLTLLASPMLAVAIFSLGTMVQAFQIAADAATPRARPLLTEDRTAQNAISTFLGAFLFSAFGIIGLSAGLFSDGGRLVLFVLSIMLIILVLATFIGWMNRLTNLGGVTEVVDQVERQTAKGFDDLTRKPWLGGQPAIKLPDDARPHCKDAYGYIQHIDMGALEKLADEADVDIHLAVRPGAFVHPERPLLLTARTLNEKGAEQADKAFIIGGQRTFHTDPSYGLIVLSEIASRALSPAVNDPGTAIDVAETMTRILGNWRAEADKQEEPVCKRVFVPTLDMDHLFDVAFGSIIRDAQGQFDVTLRLMQLLTVLEKKDPPRFARAANRLKTQTRERAELAFDYAPDLERLDDLADEPAR